MKKFYKLAVLSVLAALPFIMASCTNTGADEGGVTATLGNASVTVVSSGSADGNQAATSAAFAFETKNIESYTYVLHEGSGIEEGVGALIYANASKDDIYKVDANGKVNTTISGLNGASEYTIEFVFKVYGEAKYITQLCEVITGDYTRLINLIDAGLYSVKLQVNMPEDTYYRLLIQDGTFYTDTAKKFYTDGQMFDAYGVFDVYQGPKVFNFNDGDFIGEGDDVMGPGMTLPIKPVFSTVVIVAECDKDGKFKYPTIGGPSAATASVSSATTKSGVRPEAEYTEDCVEENPLYEIQGLYAKLMIPAIKTDKAEGDVEIKTKVTERTATFTFMPTEEVYQYGYEFFFEQQFAAKLEMMPEGPAKEAYVTSFMSGMQPYYDAISAEIQNLKKGYWFSALVVWQTDKDGLTRGYKAVDVTPMESELPAVELEITPVAPEDVQSQMVVNGESYPNPYVVAFNVKAPNKDCHSFKVLLNYTNEWNNLVHSDSYEGFDEGAIMENMLVTYGTELTEATNLGLFSGINSDAGYYMEFPSWEHRSSTLAIATFNVDEKIGIYSAEATSAWEPDVKVNEVESHLFEDLKGNWMGHIKYINGWEYNEVTPSNIERYTREAQYNVHITDDPAFDAPANYAYGPGDKNYEKVVGHYKNLAILGGTPESEAEVAGVAELNKQIENFKEFAELFKKKYANHNRLIAYGGCYKQDYIDNGATPWELFINLYYNAWGVEQMFHEYGPKMLIRITGEDTAVIETNRAYISPYCAGGPLQYYLTGLSYTSGDNMINREFPLVFDSADDIRVPPLSDDKGNDDYYLSVVSDQMGTDYISALARSEMKFKRRTDIGKDEFPAYPKVPDYLNGTAPIPPTASSATRSQASQEKASIYVGGNSFRRPYCPATPGMLKPRAIDKVVIDAQDIIDAQEKRSIK